MSIKQIEQLQNENADLTLRLEQTQRAPIQVIIDHLEAKHAIELSRSRKELDEVRGYLSRAKEHVTKLNEQITGLGAEPERSFYFY